MKKLYHFAVVNKFQKCIVCGKPLKMNLIARKGADTTCYKCWCKIKDRNPRARKDNKANLKRRIDIPK